MKKTVFFMIAALVLAFSLPACSSNNGGGDSYTGDECGGKSGRLWVEKLNRWIWCIY